MSFPIPYKRMQFRGIGVLHSDSQESAADAAQTLLSGDYSPKNMFRLIISINLQFELSGGSVAALTLDIRDPKLEHHIFLVARATLTAAQTFSPPMGDANVDAGEFQGYPIPWMPNSRIRAYAATAGAGETTTLEFEVMYLEWEIMEE